METFEPKTGCKKCGNLKLKNWADMDRDEKIVAERLSATHGLSAEELKRFRFCVRCWNVEEPDENLIS